MAEEVRGGFLKKLYLKPEEVDQEKAEEWRNKFHNERTTDLRERE
jgi:hypothetical protein